MGSVAGALIIGFGGSVTALIPLYTVGVFIAFTLSQAGMVKRWRSPVTSIELGAARRLSMG